MSLQYYRFFPGDYARDTRHLSMMQHGAYRQLIDEYMVHGPLPNDLQRLYRTCSAFSAEERLAIEFVLGEFFQLDGPVWHHARCDREVVWQRDKSESAKESANLSWVARREREANLKRTHSERISKRNANQNQNQNHKPEPEVLLTLPAWLPYQAWVDYQQHRVALRAKLSPKATELALKTLDQLRLQGDDPVAVIERSIASGWKGLFQLDHKGKPKGQPGMDEWLRNQGPAAAEKLSDDE